MKILSELIKPTDKQREFLRTVKEKLYTLYGGAAGGGKSYILRWTLVYLLIKWAKEGHKSVRVGLFCEDYPSLTDRHLKRIEIEFPSWLGTYRKTDRDFVLSPRFGSGMISFRNLDNPSKYLSSEFAAIGIDELTMNPSREVFDFLRMRLRWPGISDVKLLAGTNPGGPGHGWVKFLFRDHPGEEFGFVQALAQDNPYLPPSYYELLMSLPEAMRRAYADGDWDVFEGQVFTEFREDIHTVESFEPPRHWPRWASLDWGHAKPYSYHQYAMDDMGRIHIYRELYGWGGSPNVGSKETASEVAIKVAAMGKMPVYADPAMWIKGGHDGDSLAETFEKAYIPMLKATNDRIAGKMQIHTRLKQRTVVIHKCCSHLIRTLPILVYDKNRVEDVNSDQEDHAYDDFRYGLMVHQVPVILPKIEDRDYKDTYKDVDTAGTSWMSR